MPVTRNMKAAGFTLVELIISAVITALVAAVAVAGLRSIAAGDGLVEKAVDQKAIMRYPVEVLKNDLENIYRDSDIKFMRFSYEYDEDDGLNHLKFYTTSKTKARFGQAESDVYEVDYYVMSMEDKSFLMRRYWPNPSDELEAGGILSVVAENVVDFTVELWNGSEWSDTWSNDLQEMPELVEITIWFMHGEIEDGFVKRNFIVHWPRGLKDKTENEEDPLSFENKETQEPEIE